MRRPRSSRARRAHPVLERARATLIVLAVTTGLGAASAARANDDLDEGRRLYDRARFDEALAAFDRAAASDDLDRAELVALLEARALAHHANGDVEGAERDLAALLSIAQGTALSELAPPALRRIFARLEGEITTPLDAGVEARREGARVTIVTTVSGDVGDLVRAVRVHTRRGGRWRIDEGESVNVDTRTPLPYFVEVMGPGGVILDAMGSEDDPHVIEGSSPPLRITEAPEDEGGSALPWLLVGAGVAVAAAVGIVLYLVLASPSEFAITAPHPENP